MDSQQESPINPERIDAPVSGCKSSERSTEREEAKELVDDFVEKTQ